MIKLLSNHRNCDILSRMKKLLLRLLNLYCECKIISVIRKLNFVIVLFLVKNHRIFSSK